MTRYGYDVARRKVTETNALNYVTSFAYNPASDLKTLTDGNFNTTTWGYDEFGRVTNKVDAANNTLFVYKYDPDNRLTNRWSAAKGGTTYKYDAVGNLTNVVYPVSAQIKLGYDKLSRLTNMVDGVGTTIYGYTSAGQLLSEDGPWANDTVSFTYQNRLRSGLNVAATDGLAWTQSYGYDLARRLTNVVSAAGEFDYQYVNTEGWFYDPILDQSYYVPSCASSRVLQLALPNAAAITNSYDNVARLTSTHLLSANGTDPYASGYTIVDVDSYAYGYNQANQRTNVVRIAGDYVNYTYDDIGELLTATGLETSGTPTRISERLSYTYDAAGNLTLKKPYPTTSSQIIFGINRLNQITNSVFGYNSPMSGWSGTTPVSGATTMPATSVAINGSAAALYRDNSFAKICSVTNGLNTFTAIAQDAYGRLSTNISAVTVIKTNNAYSYDLNGNLLTDGTRCFAYDDENQLICVWQANDWRDDFVYDGKMRRRIVTNSVWSGSSWVATNLVRYVYDGNLVVQERDTNNTALISYTRGNDLSGTLQGAGGIGGLLARTEAYGGQAWRAWYALHGSTGVAGYSGNAYYHADGNGNVTYLLDSSRLMAAKYLYDPYGNMLAMSGRLAEANTYRFSSKEWNAHSGLYYYLYRLYDPNSQRWLSRDPIGESGGYNLYEFAENSPIMKVDKNGHMSLVMPNDCYSTLKIASEMAKRWVSQHQNEYTCSGKDCFGNPATIAAPSPDGHDWGVGHCLTGMFAKALGAGPACLAAGNMGNELARRL